MYSITLSHVMSQNSWNLHIGLGFAIRVWMNGWGVEYHFYKAGSRVKCSKPPRKTFDCQASPHTPRLEAPWHISKHQYRLICKNVISARP